MRRAQSVRTHHSRAATSGTPDDLGRLRESDDSTQGSSMEENLRRQLLEKDRENDKLRTTIVALQTQLKSRPPIETLQELEKEYKNLDLILQGTQRENERCMAELERAKVREKMLEQALMKLAGENWQSALDIAPAPTIAVRTAAGHSRSGSIDVRETPPASVESTAAQLEQVRLLILGMDQKLQDREESLNKAVQRAESEGNKMEVAKQEIAKLATRAST
ncbi:hypothetical protein CONPUDRAFT_141530 [Coniophora puteana RWD-64-598 SS2]|uniref:Uncharacterized protein n=1 Tax=Coniophora puteana (strain RWD-64-598) TaxID=741705 RepID=A0A5M3N8D5_CONPW|nr:uncharacterized protein CONPUDRAFT_141530 [Coniophora puteana RWD-64-598 SS2]EIW87417.1 hypothetical protein CONPUDRAFT_141530 [Coniophora puteana RWD-64-598 SS2]